MMFGLTTKAKLRRVERQRDDWETRANNRLNECRQAERQRDAAREALAAEHSRRTEAEGNARENAYEVGRLRGRLHEARAAIVDLSDV